MYRIVKKWQAACMRSIEWRMQNHDACHFWSRATLKRVCHAWIAHYQLLRKGRVLLQAKQVLVLAFNGP